MEITKDNKGLTLVALIIIVIVLAIIMGAITYSGSKEIENSREEMLLAELEEVKHFVGENYLNYIATKNVNLLVGEKLTSSEVDTLSSSINVTFITIPNSYNENEKAYYRLNPTDLLKIGVEESEDTYVVNYVTGEVINETMLNTSSGQVLYTYIRNSFNNVDLTAF